MAVIEDEEEIIRPRPSGGTVAEEMKAIDEEYGAPPVDASAIEHPEFPANVMFNASGKLALPAWARIYWFKTNCPSWAMRSEIVEINERFAIIRVIVIDSMGKERATATKKWDSVKRGSGPFYVECAETGAYARALEFLGFSAERAKTQEGREWMKNK
jgi:hypothetical protein